MFIKMGNSNCNNAVPCLGSETLGESPKGIMRKTPGKRGVTAKNRRSSPATNKRSIDNFLIQSRETG